MAKDNSVGVPNPSALGIPLEDLFSKLYHELRRIAACRMSGESRSDTLQATALVNEVWLRLNQDRKQQWPDEESFIAAASESMRRILVDRARVKRSRKNGGGMRRTTLDLTQLEDRRDIGKDLLLIDEHLERFAKFHPEKVRQLELRFFVGLTIKEIAALTGQSEKTVKRHWNYARVWLYDSIQRQMNEDHNG